MLQNRVNPYGQIISTPARGAWFGNRGLLHDNQKNIIRPFKLKAWLICLLDFKGRERQVMAHGQYTELFFFDEATAFAAGHRPCSECRRKDFELFKSFWLQGNPDYGFNKKTPIQEIDRVLHTERLKPDGSKVSFMSNVEDLPDGIFIEFESQPWLLANKLLYHWTPYGYDKKISLPLAEARVLTPRSTVHAFNGGYIPQMQLSPLVDIREE
jgi:hypothetical protein